MRQKQRHSNEYMCLGKVEVAYKYYSGIAMVKGLAAFPL